MERLAAYTLRPVRDEDEALLLAIYASSRAEEMALVPWDAAMKDAFLRSQFSAQQTHYRSYFPQAVHDMILVDGEPVGRIYVDRRADEIRILDVTMLTESRRRGIGTRIIQELMKEADDQDQSLSIYVESFNRSLGLFQRLGFVKAEETGASWLMVWRAAS
ncbi:MAG: GNAT family N-acetyltransferase [Chloroflexota bacterium]